MKVVGAASVANRFAAALFKDCDSGQLLALYKFKEGTTAC